MRGTGTQRRHWLWQEPQLGHQSSSRGGRLSGVGPPHGSLALWAGVQVRQKHVSEKPGPTVPTTLG